jgi:hypothetical protein
MPTIIFEHELEGEFTKVEFRREDDILCDEFLGYFIRFAFAAGYQKESIEDAAIALAHEYENSELIGKYPNGTKD